MTENHLMRSLAPFHLLFIAVYSRKMPVCADTSSVHSVPIYGISMYVLRPFHAPYSVLARVWYTVYTVALSDQCR